MHIEKNLKNDWPCSQSLKFPLFLSLERNLQDNFHIHLRKNYFHIKNIVFTSYKEIMLLNMFDIKYVCCVKFQRLDLRRLYLFNTSEFSLKYADLIYFQNCLSKFLFFFFSVKNSKSNGHKEITCTRKSQN